LAATEVAAKRGRTEIKARLDSLYLQTSSIKRDLTYSDSVSVLAVDEPENPAWLFLAFIGLRIVPDLDFYIQMLRTHSLDRVSKPTAKSVRRWYKRIQECAKEDPAKVRYAMVMS
jgi:hypothetical protein